MIPCTCIFCPILFLYFPIFSYCNFYRLYFPMIFIYCTFICFSCSITYSCIYFVLLYTFYTFHVFIFHAIASCFSCSITYSFMSSYTVFLVLVTVYYHRIAVLCFSYHIIYFIHFLYIYFSFSFMFMPANTLEADTGNN